MRARAYYWILDWAPKARANATTRMISEECAKLREEEWQAIQSTYPDFMPAEHPHDSEPLSIPVPVQLSEPLYVQVVADNKSDRMSLATPISHLPPLLVNILLPATYPLHDPPAIKSIEPACGWLAPPLIERLTRLLLERWSNYGVLGEWIEHILDGDQLLSSLGLVQHNPKSICIPNPSPHLLSPLLAAHNNSEIEACFQRATHTCPICINRVSGTHCIALSPCAHVVCRACVGAFWSSCIAEGDITRIGCPDLECVRESRKASIKDVKAVVTQEEVERWRWLLIKQEIDKDPTIMHCPIVSCQKPVRRPPPAKDGQPSEWDRLRTCECGFSFCMYCRRAWHGPHTSCDLITTTEFVRWYLQHPEESPERKAIEQRHGRKNVLRVVAKYQEEQANRTWLENETMTCPGCQIRVQKNMGCNHMKCSKCQQHFCYRCGAKLEAANPYRHFSSPGHACYSMLFDTHLHDEDQWVGMEGFQL